jgi:hypothetical protein
LRGIDKTIFLGITKNPIKDAQKVEIQFFDPNNGQNTPFWLIRTAKI